VTEVGHQPVLTEEVLSLLDLQPGEVVVDCTVGRGGHAVELARRIGPRGVLVVFDLDQDNLKFAAERLRGEAPARIAPIHASFARLAEVLARENLQADIVLADLGFSSSQMDDPARGFSFSVDAPLDMRLDRLQPRTAADLIAETSERELADMIFEYGEEPLARRIARKLALARTAQPIQSTAQLAQLVLEAYGSRARTSRIHPATRTFMALRIAVNDELGALRALLEQITRGIERLAATPNAPAQRARESAGWLRPGARIGIISFHSLEDRLVKRAFADLAQRGLAERLTKRPITATDAEIAANPRARSAKFRALRAYHGAMDGNGGDGPPR
jgi:16S rRNA (cytosine1402-N4)-methyltransferase